MCPKLLGIFLTKKIKSSRVPYYILPCCRHTAIYNFKYNNKNIHKGAKGLSHAGRFLLCQHLQSIHFRRLLISAIFPWCVFFWCGVNMP